MATSYYHVMAPGEMAGGGAGKSVGGGAESGGAVCEDWNALTLKMAHLHSRMENAEAKLAKKSAEQARRTPHAVGTLHAARCKL